MDKILNEMEDLERERKMKPEKMREEERKKERCNGRE